MKAGNKTKTDNITLKFKVKLIFNFTLIVVAVVSCRMVAPLTRNHNQKTFRKII